MLDDVRSEPGKRENLRPQDQFRSFKNYVTLNLPF